jgi:hypothetical protein
MATGLNNVLARLSQGTCSLRSVDVQRGEGDILFIDDVADVLRTSRSTIKNELA